MECTSGRRTGEVAIDDGYTSFEIAIGTHTDTELDELLRSNELELRRLHAERAALVNAIAGHGAWAAEHRSMSAYLRATTNCSTPTTKRDLRRSRLLHLHPRLGDALHAGYIGLDQLDEIARIQTNPRIGGLLETIIDVVLDWAEHTPHHELRARTTQLIAMLDADGADTALRDSIDHRTATVAEVGGQLFVTAHGGDAVRAAQLQAVFEAFVEVEYRRDLEQRRAIHGADADEHPLPRTPAQRRFDALIAIFAAAHASPSEGSLPKTIVNIVVDSRTVHDTFNHAGITLPNGEILLIDHAGNLEADAPDPAQALLAELIRDPEQLHTRRCETPNGSAVHPTVLLRALLTQHIRRVVTDPRNVVIDLGVARPLFTGHARTAAQLLATVCVFPGCTLRPDQVDHNHERHDGGPTTQRNANPACGHHNRVKHRRSWRTLRDDRGRTYTIRPDDTIITPAGERPPDLTSHDEEQRARLRTRELARS